MLLLQLKRGTDKPLYMQIVEQIKDLAENDTLKAGTQLPSTRQMSEKLGINRSTVYNAYQELWALGYIDSRPGSYSYIRKRHKIVKKEKNREEGIISWGDLSAPSSQIIFSSFQSFMPESWTNLKQDVINFAQLDMDYRLFPVYEFRQCMNAVLKERGAEILTYGDYIGYGPLREYIAQRLQRHGVAVTKEEILITNGSQNGIDLVLRLLTSPGQKIAVESPTYAIALPLFRFYQSEVVPIPMQKHGLDIQFLENSLTQNNFSFLYTMPNFHNPTGITTSQEHRERLLSLCESHQLPIVEDGFEEEMKYFGKVSMPIKSIDNHQIVIYLGTFSKVLFPGIRVGWVVADKKCIQRLLAIKRFSDLSSSTVVQAAIYEFCRLGLYDRHIKRMHRVYRKRMQTTIQAFKKYVPQKKISWNEPNGGYLIWFKLKDTDDEESRLLKKFVDHGVFISPGRYYFSRTNPGNFFRLSISTLDEGEIEEGIKRLGEAISEL
jgi:DNA-binding transcriptional MocR family regulator